MKCRNPVSSSSRISTPASPYLRSAEKNHSTFSPNVLLVNKRLQNSTIALIIRRETAGLCVCEFVCKWLNNVCNVTVHYLCLFLAIFSDSAFTPRAISKNTLRNNNNMYKKYSDANNSNENKKSSKFAFNSIRQSSPSSASVAASFTPPSLLSLKGLLNMSFLILLLASPLTQALDVDTKPVVPRANVEESGVVDKDIKSSMPKSQFHQLNFTNNNNNNNLFKRVKNIIVKVRADSDDQQQQHLQKRDNWGQGTFYYPNGGN